MAINCYCSYIPVNFQPTTEQATQGMTFAGNLYNLLLNTHPQSTSFLSVAHTYVQNCPEQPKLMALSASDTTLDLEIEFEPGKRWSFSYFFYPYVIPTIPDAVPEMSQEELKARSDSWKKDGRCPKCGSEGKWIKMALVCNEHGAYAGC